MNPLKVGKSHTLFVSKDLDQEDRDQVSRRRPGWSRGKAEGYYQGNQKEVYAAEFEAALRIQVKPGWYHEYELKLVRIHGPKVVKRG